MVPDHRASRLVEVTNSSRNRSPAFSPDGLSAQSSGTATSSRHPVGDGSPTLCPGCAASPPCASSAAGPWTPVIAPPPSAIVPAAAAMPSVSSSFCPTSQANTSRVVPEPRA